MKRWIEIETSDSDYNIKVTKNGDGFIFIRFIKKINKNDYVTISLSNSEAQLLRNEIEQVTGFEQKLKEIKSFFNTDDITIIPSRKAIANKIYIPFNDVAFNLENETSMLNRSIVKVENKLNTPTFKRLFDDSIFDYRGDLIELKFTPQ